MSKSWLYILLSFVLIILLIVPGSAQTRTGKFGIGVDGSMQLMLGGGTTNSTMGLGGGLSASYSVMEYFGIRTKATFNQLNWKDALGSNWTTNVMALNVYASADLMPNSTFNPFIVAGGGLAVLGNQALGLSDKDIHFIGGAGFDYFLSEFWSVSLMGEYVMTGSAWYAGSTPDNFDNDSYLRVGLQIRYYFFDQDFITKLLEAQRDRTKRK